MKTWEEEEKAASEERSLLVAEIESNEEEFQGLPYRARAHYLELRNAHLKKQLHILDERLKTIKHNVEWERRTS
jgi:hypothetical protein